MVSDAVRVARAGTSYGLQQSPQMLSERRAEIRGELSGVSGAQQSLSRSRQISVRHSSSSDGVTVGAKVERRGGGSSASSSVR